MMSPRLSYVTCASTVGLHRIAYWEWLPEGASAHDESLPTIVCVHGLTRNGRDFDALAAVLSRRYRVICPDMAGRGRSDRLANASLYAVPQYVADCVTLVARLGVERIGWVGTSMGGLIGMSYAALSGNPVGALVLNDIGPELDPVGLTRIGTYLGRAPTLSSYEECLTYTRQNSASFGPHDEAGWDLLTRHYWLRDGDRWRVHYDPRIAEPFAALAGQAPISLWPLYDAIHCPTLLVRGEQSDLLSETVAKAMCERGPRAQLMQVGGVGHAPTFIDPGQIAGVSSFFEESFQ